jgi:two-component system KDP operon response regulator KdpE
MSSLPNTPETDTPEIVETQAPGHQGTVLVVEDDEGIRQSLSTTLEALGFSVVEAENGEDALDGLTIVSFDVVLLDINMPGMGGIAACRRIRAMFPQLPIVMLSVRDSEDDKVEALEAGADDYITKPFQIRELTARLRSTIRRSHSVPLPPATVITIAGLTLDAVHQTADLDGRILKLAPKEFELLHQLMMHPARMLTAHALLTAVWGEDAQDDAPLKTGIRNLRRKIEYDPEKPRYILSDGEIGYRFRER